MLSCKTCGKQDTDETVDKFRSRLNNYKTYARKAAIGNIGSCEQQFLLKHFLQDDHHGFLVDVEVTLIDETHTSNPTKTLYPDGLNLGSDY